MEAERGQITMDALRVFAEAFVEGEPERLGSAGWWKKPLMARWSHKHLGHIAGLGRFGTHCMLITPSGCTGRLGSLVTGAELGDRPLIHTAEACLLKAGGRCGKCMEACPVEALGEKEFDRRGCWNRLNENRRDLDCFSDLPETTHVCGKCAAMMPCSFKNPVADP